MNPASVSSRRGRLLIAVTLAAVVVLGLVVTLALAQEEFPPVTMPWVFLQTSGPNTQLFIGDWYTNSGQGNGPHSFALFVPCVIPPTSVLEVELFDPELWPGTAAIDEIRDAAHNITTNTAFADDATFELLAPDGSQVALTTYPPTSATEGQWVLFTTFTRAFDCAPGDASVVYRLRVSTSDNDDNSWRFRVTHPDNVPGTGDETLLATYESSFQHAATADPKAVCADPTNSPPRSRMDFYFFVNPGTPSITLNNFDLDVPGYAPNATVTYFQPDGTSVAGTPSGDAVWNNGNASTRGGDVFADPQTGWWRAEVCIRDDNQYIFECPDFCVPEPPPLGPDLSQQCIQTGQSQIIQYTIPYSNASADDAVYEPDLTFSLPRGTTFVSCSGGLSCSETSPGQVTFTLDPVLAAEAAEQVSVDVRLGAGTPDPLVSTAEFDYTDVYNNNYDPLVDTFTTPLDPCIEPPYLQISKVSDLACYERGESQIVNYTIDYANVGAGPAFDATVTDTLPGGATFVSCSGAPCDETSPGSGVVVYSLGDLAAGAGGSLGLTARVDDNATGRLTNRARIEAGENAAEATNVLGCCPGPGAPPPSGPTPTPWATWAPIPTPPVLFLPETGDSPASSPICWLWLPLLLVGLPAACVIRCRRG